MENERTIEEMTVLVNQACKGDKKALDQLYPVVYQHLKGIAARERHKWYGLETLNTTSLVHEVYFKLVKQDRADYVNQSHFFHICGKAIRQLLCSYTEKKSTAKRGGDQIQVEMEAVEEKLPALDNTLLDEIGSLNLALKKLESLDVQYGRIVECRFFAGMSIEETANALDVSPATIKRKWAFARSFLFTNLRNAS